MRNTGVASPPRTATARRRRAAALLFGTVAAARGAGASAPYPLDAPAPVAALPPPGGGDAAAVFIVTGADGTVSGFEGWSSRLLWTVDTGGPLVRPTNSTSPNDDILRLIPGFRTRSSAEVGAEGGGRDVELFMRLTGDGGERLQRLPETLHQLLSRTPLHVAGGQSMLVGSKSSSYFAVDALTGDVLSSGLRARRSPAVTGSSFVVEIVRYDVDLQTIRGGRRESVTIGAVELFRPSWAAAPPPGAARSPQVLAQGTVDGYLFGVDVRRRDAPRGLWQRRLHTAPLQLHSVHAGALVEVELALDSGAGMLDEADVVLQPGSDAAAAPARPTLPATRTPPAAYLTDIGGAQLLHLRRRDALPTAGVVLQALPSGDPGCDADGSCSPALAAPKPATGPAVGTPVARIARGGLVWEGQPFDGVAPGPIEAALYGEGESGAASLPLPPSPEAGLTRMLLHYAAAAVACASTIYIVRVAVRAARAAWRAAGSAWARHGSGRGAAAGAVRGAAPGAWQRGRLLGRGGFGCVFLAVGPSGELAAVKVIPLAPGTGERQLRRLTREVGVLSSLKHPHIVEYFGCSLDRATSELQMFMEYMAGGSLGALVRRMESPLAESAAARYVSEVLLGVAHLHANRIVHRDLKGDNVLLSSEGVTKLADFGACHDLCLAASATRVIGTPLWMAPEAISGVNAAEGGDGAIGSFGEVASLSDVWSVGILTCELLGKGQPPWPTYENPMQALFAVANWSEELPPRVPEGLSAECIAFLRLCLNPYPHRRSPAAALLQDPWLRDRGDALPPAAAGDELLPFAAGPSELRQLALDSAATAVAAGPAVAELDTWSTSPPTLPAAPSPPRAPRLGAPAARAPVDSESLHSGTLSGPAWGASPSATRSLPSPGCHAAPQLGATP
eukprot:TRINITY_DN50306_c0_g1_i1.p1 TRINITY_DN50306_c0_g1~~TRINITY_DN50306_c0_g1_i1.p1  ORF type:complete len:903 (+),score=216.22 TRINITY_DN50306_c0_g1_i1:78-2786(+)